MRRGLEDVTFIFLIWKIAFQKPLIIEISQEICIKEQTSVLLQTVLHFNIFTVGLCSETN